jgi:thiamine-phosphate pyrophosphorylase
VAEGWQLYYITDRKQFPGDERAQRSALLAKIAEAARAGVDYIQLRERDLSGRELERLARESVAIVERLRIENRELKTRLLINSRTDIALAAGADGVHLRSDDVSPVTVRSIWTRAAHESQNADRESIVAVSCHTASDVALAAAKGADFAVFAPVFEKKDAPRVEPRGLLELREVSAGKIPVFPLGGVTIENAASCLASGAAGIAGIRLFQENKIEEVARSLRALRLETHGATESHHTDG